MTRLFFILSLLFSLSSLASEGGLFSLSFGQVQIGESRIPIELKNFKIISKTNSLKIETNFIKDTVQWVKTEEGLLTPRARIYIKIFSLRKDIHLSYANRPILPEKKNNFLYVELYVPLFKNQNIKLFADGKEVGKLFIEGTPSKDKTETHYIDYTCAPYKLNFIGLEREYLSASCRLRRIGSWGEEKPHLDVTWTTTNYKLLDESPSPFLTTFTGCSSVSTILKNENGQRREVNLKAQLPKRLKRIKTAIGFGPYAFKSINKDGEELNSVSPALMIYAKLDLAQNTSLRFFDALLWSESFFNNAGAYFAYELAQAFDNRFQLIPLLGVQAISFSYKQNEEKYSHFIYPQGIEAIYKHPFGFENYILTGGLFFSTQSSIEYTNAWVRFGKKIFWELNYIKWGHKDEVAQTWGLSVGIPFLSFL